MGFIIFGLIILIIIIIIASHKPFIIKTPWQTFLDGFQIPTEEFYEAVYAGLKARQITNIKVKDEFFLERHILSAKRMYMRITQDEYVYYICCAPYGTGTFISSWLCIKNENFANNIPIISKLAGINRNNKTFYQMDTEAMFRSAVHATVLEAVNNMKEAKGLRGLSELEGQFTRLN